MAAGRSAGPAAAPGHPQGPRGAAAAGQGPAQPQPPSPTTPRGSLTSTQSLLPTVAGTPRGRGDTRGCPGPGALLRAAVGEGPAEPPGSCPRWLPRRTGRAICGAGQEAAAGRRCCLPRFLPPPGAGAQPCTIALPDPAAGRGSHAGEAVQTLALPQLTAPGPVGQGSRAAPRSPRLLPAPALAAAPAPLHSPLSALASAASPCSTPRPSTLGKDPQPLREATRHRHLTSASPAPTPLLLAAPRVPAATTGWGCPHRPWERGRGCPQQPCPDPGPAGRGAGRQRGRREQRLLTAGGFEMQPPPGPFG